VLTFVAVAYRRYRQIPVLVHSLAAQTDDRWQLKIYHDGPDERHADVVASAARSLVAAGYGEVAGRISYAQTDERQGLYGHPLRAAGLKLATTPWVLLTNDDNYYAPVFVERMLRAAARAPRAAVVACNMIHSHVRTDYEGFGGQERSYGLLKTMPRKCHIDVGSFMARTELAQAVGFPWTSHDGDGDYFEALLARAGRHDAFVKVPGVLFVHN